MEDVREISIEVECGGQRKKVSIAVPRDVEGYMLGLMGLEGEMPGRAFHVEGGDGVKVRIASRKSVVEL